ncbi:nif-specific transcriptional activator NifA [Dissulfurimicrobium hydrothermale]|uniref:nif-specific transcriptional activator NifA n=1 Tax=Dissulfurimicrobium hydrothermale TaxID=1750598 RepID=UPI001EDBB2ED|nr:nif-specific transcriptional activator NifA [Dissulfurimicrobium hydrothermale]UKL14059.1 nif-specific transcriptional activator NifA [Dissulfurimicrobium hydrothermale]
MQTTVPKKQDDTIHNSNPDTLAIEIQALYEISLLIGSAVFFDKTLLEILRVLHDTLHMERATLVLLDHTGERLIIKASYGLTKEEEQRGVYGLGEGITGQVFRTCAPFVVPDIKAEPLFLNRTKARDRIITKERLSFIGVPIILAGKPVGVLTVDRLFGPEISFEEDVRFLTVVATLVAQFLNLHQAIHKKEESLLEENRSLRAELHGRYARHNIVGSSKAMHEVLLAVEKVAPTRATVLILGESGTGKELIARAIHQASPRHERPFIKVNCAALPETLLESELFGHEKGAFTGATARKKGRFELADGGTLFLDEIGELPLSLQAKLLRVLQEQQFELLGGTQTITVDIRLIAATNRDLNMAVDNGSFRADLYYRLNVIPIVIPPLRNRKEDIPLLAEHFLRESNRQNNRNVRLSKEVLDLLMSYDWPGNVRELQNLIERLVIMADENYIQPSDIPSFMLRTPGLIPNTEAVETQTNDGPRQIQQIQKTTLSLCEIERRELEEALRQNNWIQAKAARVLGLTQRQIGYKIKKHGITIPKHKA